ncbi:MAG TPA: tetratricopeptide repeat protein [Pyrinomonadaceae bacterium]|nr:tetratricopeptide repeat protein [Pyrinomonadaceae bacterium]
MKLPLFLLCVSTFALACGLGPDMTKDRVEREASPTPTPFIPEKPVVEYLHDGDAAFSSGNFSDALGSYKKAFEIEQRAPKLDEKERNGLVRNLAMSYIRTGDTEHARLTIAYGLSKSYNNAIFHYTLACSHAADGNESDTLYRLRTAYNFRDKLPKGEKLPDPLADTCFERLADGETFKKAVEEMKRMKPGA